MKLPYLHTYGIFADWSDIVAKAKCKICGNSLSNDDRYSPNGKHPYYCTETEYNEHILIPKKTREKLENHISSLLDIVFCPPVIKKKINELNSIYALDVILETFIRQDETIKYWLTNKSFNNLYGKVSYVFSIIANNIDDVDKDIKSKRKFKKKLEDKDDNIIDLSVFNTSTIVVNNSSKNNDISRFLEEGDI